MMNFFKLLLLVAAAAAAAIPAMITATTVHGMMPAGERALEQIC